jgi:hypothetical protein
MNQGPRWDCLMKKKPEVENLVTLSLKELTYDYNFFKHSTYELLLYLYLQFSMISGYFQ